MRLLSTLLDQIFTFVMSSGGEDQKLHRHSYWIFECINLFVFKDVIWKALIWNQQFLDTSTK